eukprot:gene1313-12469_t
MKRAGDSCVTETAVGHANKPEARAAEILKVLQNEDWRIKNIDCGITVVEKFELHSETRRLMATVCDKEMIRLFEHGYQQWMQDGGDSDFSDEDGYLVPCSSSSGMKGARPHNVCWRNVGMFARDLCTPLADTTFE